MHEKLQTALSFRQEKTLPANTTEATGFTASISSPNKKESSAETCG